MDCPFEVRWDTDSGGSDVTAVPGGSGRFNMEASAVSNMSLAVLRSAATLVSDGCAAAAAAAAAATVATGAGSAVPMLLRVQVSRAKPCALRISSATRRGLSGGRCETSLGIRNLSALVAGVFSSSVFHLLLGLLTIPGGGTRGLFPLDKGPPLGGLGLPPSSTIDARAIELSVGPRFRTAGAWLLVL